MSAVPASETLLEARGLSKRFGGFNAVSDVNLKVRKGTIHALIGPNGAGKSTTFNLLTKFLQPTAGQIYFRNQDITNLSPVEVARLGVGRSFQISAVFTELTVRENLRVALQRQIGSGYRFWQRLGRLRVLDAQIDRLLEPLGLDPYAEVRAADLSYGRKRALEIATTLALDPEMILLDEPMAGLGFEDIERTSELIKAAAANRTVLMVEHNLSVVARLANTITVLARGQVLKEGTYAEVSKDQGVIDAYLGDGHV
jgi:branched-chain amino acid transport system ATP-binding protein